MLVLKEDEENNIKVDAIFQNDKKMAAVKDEDFHVIDLNGDEERVSSEHATVNIPRELLECNHQQKMVKRCQVAGPFRRKMRQVKQVILLVFICLI